MAIGPITRELAVPRAVDWLWAMVSDSHGLKMWLCDEAEVERRAGGRIALSWHEFGTFTGLVEAVEPHHRFSFRWMAPAGQRPRAGNSTRVEMLLAGDPNVTRLKLTESGFGDLPVSEDRKAIFVRENSLGWDHALANLRRLAGGREH